VARVDTAGRLAIGPDSGDAELVAAVDDGVQFVRIRMNGHRVHVAETGREELAIGEGLVLLVPVEAPDSRARFQFRARIVARLFPCARPDLAGVGR